MSCVLIAAVSASAAPQTATLSCVFGGKKVGSGVFGIEAQRDTTFVETTVFDLDVNGQKIHIESKVRVSKDGDPLHDDEKETVGGVTQKDVSIQFTATGATVTDKATGKKTDYPAPKGESRRDPSGLWFVTITPKKGQVSVATAFSTDSMAWRKTSRTYVGDKPVTLAGKKLAGHQLKDESDGHTILALVDDRGLPLDVDITGFHFTRG